jgi:hypothetical protein
MNISGIYGLIYSKMPAPWVGRTSADVICRKKYEKGEEKEENVKEKEDKRKIKRKLKLKGENKRKRGKNKAKKVRVE